MQLNQNRQLLFEISYVTVPAFRIQGTFFLLLPVTKMLSIGNLHVRFWLGKKTILLKMS